MIEFKTKTKKRITKKLKTPNVIFEWPTNYSVNYVRVEYFTIKPKEKPATREFSTDTAARSMVLKWPANIWVTAPSEYLETNEKMAGPARYQSIFDSNTNCLKKSLGLVIGSMSGAAAVKTAVVDSGILVSWCLFFGLVVRRGWVESSSILIVNIAQEGRFKAFFVLLEMVR